MADTNETAPVADDDGVSVPKRKRGRPRKADAMRGQERNKSYRERQKIKDEWVHMAIGTLLGVCIQNGIEMPFITQRVLYLFPDLRHETINQIRGLIKIKCDNGGYGATAMKWLETEDFSK